MDWLQWGLAGVLGLLVVAVTIPNALFMVRPKEGALEVEDFVVLIPARNEAERIGPLLAELVAQGAMVVVYDDASDDNTGEIAREAGAQVVRGTALPEGWTGKNHACWRLSQIAAEVSPAKWMMFLDADVRVAPGFVAAWRGMIGRHGPRFPVMTALLRVVPASLGEAMMGNWVWLLLVIANPFWLVARTGMSHNRFLNGQLSLWRMSTYLELDPHQMVKDKVMEDVAIGRMLARQKVRVLVADGAGHARVHMYDSARAAVAGFTKNACFVAGRGIASSVLAGGLAALAIAAFAVPVAGLVLVLGGMIAAGLVRRNPLYGLTAPIDLLIGAWLIARSNLRFDATWKGRTYRF